jgi:hypothetical protein
VTVAGLLSPPMVEQVFYISVKSTVLYSNCSRIAAAFFEREPVGPSSRVQLRCKETEIICIIM